MSKHHKTKSEPQEIPILDPVYDLPSKEDFQKETDPELTRDTLETVAVDEGSLFNDTTVAQTESSSDALPAEVLKESKPEKVFTQEEYDALYQSLLRAAADFDNYKKRVKKEDEETRLYANQSLLKDVFPIVDNIERALTHSEKSQDITSLIDGVKLIYKQFLELFSKYHIEQFSALKESFDPSKHEAIQQIETNEYPPGTVIDEYLKGYFLNKRLVRPAMVIVSKAAPVAEKIPLEPEGAEVETQKNESNE